MSGDPFTQDGAACPASAVGHAVLFTNTTNGARELLAQTYQPENVQTRERCGGRQGEAGRGILPAPGCRCEPTSGPS